MEKCTNAVVKEGYTRMQGKVSCIFALAINGQDEIGTDQLNDISSNQELIASSSVCQSGDINGAPKSI